MGGEEALPDEEALTFFWSFDQALAIP
jgi:hypothetical protein